MNEVESLELQEFLQAEKVTLTDSLKDIEQEVRPRIIYKTMLRKFSSGIDSVFLALKPIKVDELHASIKKSEERDIYLGMRGALPSLAPHVIYTLDKLMARSMATR